MITERTLRRWRREALLNSQKQHTTPVTSPEEFNVQVLMDNELNSRILRLTQELLDLHLVRKE
jgi:hypothetical protein